MERESMILCDTDVFIEYLKGNAETRSILQSIGLIYISVSTITVMELYYGAFNKNELNMIKKALSELIQIDLERAISKQAVSLIEIYSKSHDLRIPDALIAATAIVNRIPLFTYNIKDFQFISELTIYKLPK